jgi:hypothetical protein
MPQSPELGGVKSNSPIKLRFASRIEDLESKSPCVLSAGSLVNLKPDGRIGRNQQGPTNDAIGVKFAEIGLSPKVHSTKIKRCFLVKN